MKEWNRTDVKGLAIINHERNFPPLRRNNHPFTKPQIEDSKHNEFGLISTKNLFLLIRGMMKYNWDKRIIRAMMYKKGLITNIPDHYTPIGVIENYWEHHKVVGIRLQYDKIKLNEKIGLVLDFDYLEQNIKSLQVEKNDREEAIIGELAGIKTSFPKEMLRKKTIVYKVNYKLL